MTPSSPDAVLSSAVDLARAAVLEIAPADHVGDHLGVSAEIDGLATHSFACLARGYTGWAWAVTVAVVPHGASATVSEVVLLPGDGAILAPEWTPWNERVRAGDLGPGDLYPTAPDDPRLEPGFGGADALEAADETASTAAPLRPEQWELGLGRENVLSPYGRGVAADRWFDGDFGPEAPMAKAAPGQCRGCGFLMPMGGLLGQAFGVCANEFGADGRVVALGYGCGAHSSVRPIEGTGVPVTDIAIDEHLLDTLDLRSGDRLIELPAAVAELVADGSEIVVLGEVGSRADAGADAAESEADAAPAESESESYDLEAVDEPAGIIGLQPEDSDEDDDDLSDDEDEDDELEDEDDELDEDEDEDDEDDEDDDDAVSPDQIALELDDVEDIEPDEIL